MRNIFITTQQQLLSSWIAAFPNAELAFNIPAISENNDMMFWLHMNVDRQQWMSNAIAEIKRHYPTAKMVVLANAPNQAEAFYCLSLGAQGYCHAFSAAQLLNEIKTVVINGGVWMGNDLLKQLIEITTSLVGNQPQQVYDLLNKLTKREQEVALQAAKGLSNKEIARILSITDRTVKAHLSSTFETLGAKDRLQLALMLNNKHLGQLNYQVN
ncbi:MAG: response regulator transcription factor [Methylotenera sp.]